ncbi:histidine phosphatase family protein [Egicoccus sp. AB-alg6-2]|uniref:histidine phosphatase family protein n=1 Tax=Egicoccus sp. AB-alg6-2 TaxID=3242692 RepID=UPI00359DC917
MELVLIRHGQPEWSRDRTARVDPGLTDRGRQQALRVARRVAREGFDRLLVSTATRARETAAPLRELAGHVPAEEREWLHEIRMPSHWEGTPQEEVDRTFREARVRSREDWWQGLPGGESFGDFHARVTAGLEQELAALGLRRDEHGFWQLPDEAPRIVMVAHAGTNSVVLGHLLGLSPQPWEWERFASDHASLTRLATRPIGSGHIFSLQRFSDVEHLPAELVTG